MFVCSSGHLWGTWLSACPRCSEALRALGSEEGDTSLPQLRQFPMRRALRHVVGVDTTFPRVRDSIEVWRSHLLAQGFAPDAINELTKPQLQDLARLHTQSEPSEAV